MTFTVGFDGIQQSINQAPFLDRRRLNASLGLQFNDNDSDLALQLNIPKAFVGICYQQAIFQLFSLGAC